ncbi:DUF4007 family protein [Mucilaginibacter myungsuensis]|uniref:DUF4007 family protein n=1 Tax=Mucilaginibacter myungsuensis TaxID=649104 RepID=A0A929L4D6_9SPHI|nr:DUF4007 family protein [Mucilaginibacter myungsuensis]MBE9663016.1 DUF4007 family protein [Mucilaginibacter myungsuensis]MDN3598646.1 DUF4007 family protein [Mucilaginibacter myungsuensis]
MIKKSNRFSFSGHDSFQCRLMWLKKGYDFLQENNDFNTEAAGIVLGVGNNMVRSIRFWLRAFGVTNEQDQLTDFAHLMFGKEEGQGLDPFLEDEATLWILHFRLVAIGYASSYNLIFNEFRKNKIEFTRADYLNFVKLRLEERSLSISENSINEDFVVFIKMYLNQDGQRDKEDSFSGILTELGLLDFFVKQREDSKKESENVFFIAPDEREDIPEVAILYAILENETYQDSVSLSQLETDENSPGSVFALTRSGLSQKLRSIAKNYPAVVLSEQAGIRELQFKDKPQSDLILKNYYANQARYESV